MRNKIYVEKLVFLFAEFGNNFPSVLKIDTTIINCQIVVKKIPALTKKKIKNIIFTAI